MGKVAAFMPGGGGPRPTQWRRAIFIAEVARKGRMEKWEMADRGRARSRLAGSVGCDIADAEPSPADAEPPLAGPWPSLPELQHF